MIARLIAASARNPFLILLLMGGISATGVWAIYHTPLDAIPGTS